MAEGRKPESRGLLENVLVIERALAGLGALREADDVVTGLENQIPGSA